MSANDHVRRATILSEIAAERKRQILDEGWTEGHDDMHDQGEMALAAACYAIAPVLRDAGPGEFNFRQRDAHEARRHLWPWAAEWWRPKSDRRDLVRAAALIVAELERRDRANPAEISANSPAAGRAGNPPPDDPTNPDVKPLNRRTE